MKKKKDTNMLVLENRFRRYKLIETSCTDVTNRHWVVSTLFPRNFTNFFVSNALVDTKAIMARDMVDGRFTLF